MFTRITLTLCITTVAAGFSSRLAMLLLVFWVRFGEFERCEMSLDDKRHLRSGDVEVQELWIFHQD
jgi:hypothetical protein